MLARAARVLPSAVATLWAIATGTFLLMEHAPGGPGSEERRLDPAVEVANLVHLGLADPLRAPCAGVASVLPAAGDPVDDGAAAGRIDGPGGCDVPAPVTGEVLRVLARPGDRVREGQVLAAVRPSLARRYLRTMAAVATLDLGVTYTSRGERTVRENLAEGLPVSAAVGGLALAFALLAGIPLGLLAASRRGSWTDRLLSVLSTAGVCVPAIVLGPVLLYLFAIRLRWLPPGGLDDPAGLVLPAATLGLILASVLQRMTRAGAAAFLGGPVAVALAARGLRPRRVVGVHALRHALIPVLGFLPPAVASLLTGSVVVEGIFNVPGVARHLVGAALNRDHPMVLGVVLVYSVLLVVLNVAAELLHPVVDPRVGEGGR